MIARSREIEHAVRSLASQARESLDEEFLRALRICDVVEIIEGPLVFSPGAGLEGETWEGAWKRWLQGDFEWTVAPTLLGALEEARLGHYRELLDLDLALAAKLDPPDAARSSAAGRRLLGRLSLARGVRWLDRIQSATGTGATPGHFAVAYACQGALFHLSPRAVLATCAYWEWIAAAAATGYRLRDEFEGFLASSAPVVRRIIEQSPRARVGRSDQTSRHSF